MAFRALLAFAALFATLFLEMPEDGARIDPQVARGLSAIAAVELQHRIDVLALPLLARLAERQHLTPLTVGEPQIFGAQQRLVGQHDRLLEAIFQLPNIARPAMLAQRGNGSRRQPL